MQEFVDVRGYLESPRNWCVSRRLEMAGKICICTSEDYTNRAVL